LFANQFVNIQLLVDTLQNQVIIPVAAVQHGAPNGVNSTFVYLVGADSTVSVQRSRSAPSMASAWPSPAA